MVFLMCLSSWSRNSLEHVRLNTVARRGVLFRKMHWKAKNKYSTINNTPKCRQIERSSWVQNNQHLRLLRPGTQSVRQTSKILRWELEVIWASNIIVSNCCYSKGVENILLDATRPHIHRGDWNLPYLGGSKRSVGFKTNLPVYDFSNLNPMFTW